MASRQFRSGRSGFSLTEALMVITIIGIVTLLAYPRVERTLNRRDVVSARAGLGGLIIRARAVAIQSRRPLVITVSGGTVSVTGTGGQTLGGASMFLDLQGNFGVTVTPSASSISVQPTGLVTGTPYTVVLAKGTWADTVRVTGYGLIQ